MDSPISSLSSPIIPSEDFKTATLAGQPIVPPPSPPRYPLLGSRPSMMISTPRMGYAPPMPLAQDQRQQLLAAFNAHPAVADLRRWLNDAPKIMAENGSGPLLPYTLSTQETIACVHWKGQHYITGTDIVKILRFRFACLGKPVGNVKKFEEGVFSDLRNLKAGEHATLEEPKSEFLEFLYKHNCIRTQKKQKVFYWYEVRHDDLVVEAFERDAKRQNQATNISNFLRSQAANMAYMQPSTAGLLGQNSPRLIPRFNLPMTMQMGHMGQMGLGSPMSPLVSSPFANPFASAGFEEWDQQSSIDPAVDFINELPLEDNLSAYDQIEPMPKSPRLEKAIDPSLIAALPAKAQRKVRQQVQQAESVNRISQLGAEVIKAKDLVAPAAKEELKDPLLGDPFNFEGVTFDSLFSQDYATPDKESDLFLF